MWKGDEQTQRTHMICARFNWKLCGFCRHQFMAIWLNKNFGIFFCHFDKFHVNNVYELLKGTIQWFFLLCVVIQFLKIDFWRRKSHILLLFGWFKNHLTATSKCFLLISKQNTRKIGQNAVFYECDDRYWLDAVQLNITDVIIRCELFSHKLGSSSAFV